MGRKPADGLAVLRWRGACRLPSPAEDYLETPLDLTEYLIENKAATFMMRVDGDSMKDGGILDGDLLVVYRAAKPVNGSVVVVAVNGAYAHRLRCSRSTRHCFSNSTECSGRHRSQRL